MSIAIIGTGAQAARMGDGENNAHSAGAAERAQGSEAAKRSRRAGAAERAHPPGDADADADETLRRLREKLERYQHRRARRAGWTRRFVPTGLAPLDAVLPHGGLPRGAVTEILADGPGIGAMSLALRIAGQIAWRTGGDAFERTSTPESPRGPHCVGAPVPAARGVSTNIDRASTFGSPRGLNPAAQDEKSDYALKPAARCAEKVSASQEQGHIVLVDTHGDFYPPAGWQHGIALDRLIVVRTRNLADAFWAVDQSLRCSAVAFVIAPLSPLDQRRSRRLQLAAESSGCVGLILKPARSRDKSFAAAAMLLEQPQCEQPAGAEGVAQPMGGAHHHLGDSYPCRITLLTVREGTPAKPVWVDLHHETGAWPLHPVPFDRSAAKTA